MKTFSYGVGQEFCRQCQQIGVADGYDYFAEVIGVNPATNKIYVSDSKNNLLYEIED
jgi:hypothetical protein